MNHEVLDKANANREEVKRLIREVTELTPVEEGWRGHVKRLFVRNRKEYQISGKSCIKGEPDYCITLTEEDLNALVSLRDKKIEQLNKEFFELDGSPQDWN